MSSKKTVNVDGGVFFLLTTPLMGDPRHLSLWNNEKFSRNNREF